MRHGRDDELIVRLHDCGTNSELWREVLESFIARVGADGAVLFTENFDPGALPFYETACFERREVETIFFGRHRDNPWTRASLRRPMGVVARTEETVPVRTLVDSEFYVDCLEPFGLLHSLGANLFLADGVYAGFTFLRGRRRGAFSDRALADMQRFVPHFASAVQVGLRLAAADLQRATALEALDRSDTATILLDRRGRAQFVNAAAERLLAETPDLALDANRCLRAALGDQALQQAIGLAVRGERGATVALDGQGPVDAVISPLGEHQTCVAGEPARAVVFLRPIGSPQVSARGLAERFGLTEAESRVAASLVRGHGLPAAAAQLGVSINTVRTHVARVFAKTGTHRQAELVSLLVSRR